MQGRTSHKRDGQDLAAGGGEGGARAEVGQRQAGGHDGVQQEGLEEGGVLHAEAADKHFQSTAPGLLSLHP